MLRTRKKALSMADAATCFTTRQFSSFWRGFGTAALTLFLLSAVTLLGLFVEADPGASLAAVADVSFSPEADPYERASSAPAAYGATSDYLYRESLPLGYKDWSWSSENDWRSVEQAFEGDHSLRVSFTAPWAGVHINGPALDISYYSTLALAVYVPVESGDVFIDLYDADGKSLGEQSVSWYAVDDKLVPNRWNYVRIPLENLMLDRKTSVVSGVSFSAEIPGVRYIDAVKFERVGASHAPWLPQ